MTMSFFGLDYFGHWQLLTSIPQNTKWLLDIVIIKYFHLMSSIIYKVLKLCFFTALIRGKIIQAYLMKIDLIWIMVNDCKNNNYHRTPCNKCWGEVNVCRFYIGCLYLYFHWRSNYQDLEEVQSWDPIYNWFNPATF